ncbi:TetR/AcrR family transcriptional regulator [Pengzhenrongella frigida]|uniref:TetR/AcrR family transcriptional regulator n=2 Tax=Pengzhenrongella frigida TaxID=1259133 RepID=A0A4Q5N2Y8_9MICO|nr:TetR/AcrR family transcriptional regulator [Cellulomonas sp. HLT2-17]
MTAGERREQILRAALTVFAAGGYSGTTTDQVARAARVSQPYVVRLFGGKQQLFAEVYERASRRVLEALAAVAPGPEATREMGEAYVGLLADRDLLLLLLHGFAAGSEPEIGRLARHTLGESYRLYRERTGEGEDEARVFVAHGMLINVMLAVGAPEHAGEDLALDALTVCTFGSGLPVALAGARAEVGR